MGFRFVAFLTALVLYGLGGSPTPNEPGLYEIILGILLVCAVAPEAARQITSVFSLHGSLWALGARVLLLYGLTIPVLGGLINGNGLGPIFRDLVAFLFFLLPVFAAPVVTQGPVRKDFILFAVALIGVSFSVRVLFPVWDAAIPWVKPGEPLYLGIAPTVLFAGLWFAGTAITKVASDEPFSKTATIVPGAAVLSALCVFAMAASLQRASLALFALALAILLGWMAFKAPKRALLPLLLVATVLLGAFPFWDDLWRALSVKTTLVGMNSRFEEAAAVMDTLTGSAGAVLFGKGWGADVVSPAVGGLSVNFTHSLVTAIWLKTGLVGIALAGVYMTGIAFCLLRILLRDPPLALALISPAVIDTFFYASYKSLDFGLILLLAVSFSGKRE